jgi:acetylornithine deacetylase
MTIDPFGGDWSDGKIWGRGASDTKGSLAAMLWALREVRDEIDKLGVEPLFAGFMSEESSQHGSRHYAGNHRDEVDFAIAGEPTALQVVHAHKACSRVAITMHGRAVHSSKPELGDNAVVKMAALIGKLDADLRRRITGFKDDVLGASTHSINQCQGGTAANVVPDRCRIVIDFRSTPDLYRKGVANLLREGLQAIGHEEAEVRVLGEAPTLKTDPDHEVIGKLREAGAGLTTAPWFCDAGWLAEAGIPAVALGPGSIDQAHTKDEWIRVEDLEAGAAFFTRFLRAF